ncbi:MAG: tetratricopeptide repeat protein [Rhodospirillales bacterium]|nr:tetratricopeptide repeat protein [Rhodospirillales bacterium]
MNQLSNRNSTLAERTAIDLGAGRLSEAESGCRRILAERPDDGGALRMLGIIAFRSGRPDAALRLIERAVTENPSDAEAQNSLGQVHLQMGDSLAAARAFESALSLNSQNLAARMNLAVLLRGEGDFEGALAHLMPALEYQRANPDLLNEIGVAHLHAGRVTIAMEWLQQAVRMQPGSAIYHNHLALALQGVGEIEKAIAGFDSAIAIDPQYTEARWNRSVALMAIGRYREGVEDWHLRRLHRSFRPRRIDLPEWDGKKLDAGRLLVHAEQGLGDQILYASLLPLIAERAPEITIETEPRLVRLFARSFPGANVIAAADQLRAEDLGGGIVARHSIVDLARELAFASAADLPAQGYLKPDQARRDEFRARLEAFGPPPYVGISWRSGADLSGGAKTIPLHQWRKILLQGPATFVNLQDGDTDDDVDKAARLSGARIYTDPGLDRFTDLDGLAAMTAALDQVITTSNITPMIAGAVGVPCWIMLRKSAYWYWGTAATQSPFFASVKCYRQSTPGEWEDVIEQLALDFRHALKLENRGN